MKDRVLKEKGITTAEASEYIGCSAYTIRQMAREKLIPHYRINSKILFTKVGLDTWIKDQEIKNYISA